MTGTGERRRVRIPIRYKMLLVVSIPLLLAIGTQGYLAAKLFTSDKLAYIYDLNAAMVASLSEQTRVSMTVLDEALELFAREALSPGAGSAERRQSAQNLFLLEPDVVRVELYRQGEEAPKPVGAFVNPAALGTLELNEGDLAMLRKERPVPFAALLREPGQLFVQNSSLEPSAALLTVAFAMKDSPHVVAADLRHERLLRIFGRSRVQETFLVDERGELLAHANAAWVLARRDLSASPLVKEAMRGGVEQGVKEFTAEDGSRQLGAFGRVPIGRLWVLTQTPEAEALRASRELIRRTVLFGLGVVLAAFLVSLFLSRLVTSPIRRLRAATERLGQGQFDVHLDVDARDEIGDLARAFNSMAAALKSAQSQLVQSEKMAAFGQLGAGITHEVKNPMTGIISFTQLALRQLENPDKMRELLQLVEQSALRCREILVNFLKFARADAGSREHLQVNALVENAVTMMRHQLAVHNVRLEVELGEGVPGVLGNAPELQQVMLNLALNAQQAMPEGGVVRVSTAVGSSGEALIRVADTGPGIPVEIQGKIFEPFFTTKPAGQGTGLGLSVSFGIIQAHRGTLSVSSSLGQGATFTISLPGEHETQAQARVCGM